MKCAVSYNDRIKNVLIQPGKRSNENNTSDTASRNKNDDERTRLWKTKSNKNKRNLS